MHQSLHWADHSIILFIPCRIPSGRAVLTSTAQKKVPQLRERKGLLLARHGEGSKEKGSDRSLGRWPPDPSSVRKWKTEVNNVIMFFYLTIQQL